MISRREALRRSLRLNVRAFLVTLIPVLLVGGALELLDLHPFRVIYWWMMAFMLPVLFAEGVWTEYRRYRRLSR